MGVSFKNSCNLVCPRMLHVCAITLVEIGPVDLEIKEVENVKGLQWWQQTYFNQKSSLEPLASNEVKMWEVYTM